MKLRFAAAFLAFAAAAAAGARTPAAQAFLDAPDDGSVFVVDSVSRLDLVDFAEAGLPNTTSDLLGGQTRLSRLDSLSLTLATGATRQDMHIVPGGIAVVTTFATAVPLSALSLYDGAWRPLPFKGEPGLRDWLREPTKANLEKASRLLPFVAATAAVDPGGRTVTFTNTMEGYFADPAEKAAAASLLKPVLTAPL